jgi:butyryl-CoA dehydrogenase
VLENKHIEFREKIREFALRQVAPVADALDQEQRFPSEHIEPMTKLGLLGMLIPEQYGGHPVDTVSYAIAVEELSRVCGSTGITIAAHNSLGTWPVYKFGTEAQKKKYLPRAANGELMSFGLTEPEAGSDAGGTKTMARRDGDHWVINGSKCWITSATRAFATIATARTSEGEQARTPRL